MCVYAREPLIRSVVRRISPAVAIGALMRPGGSEGRHGGQGAWTVLRPVPVATVRAWLARDRTPMAPRHRGSRPSVRRGPCHMRVTRGTCSHIRGTAHWSARWRVHGAGADSRGEAPAGCPIHVTPTRRLPRPVATEPGRGASMCRVPATVHRSAAAVARFVLSRHDQGLLWDITPRGKSCTLDPGVCRGAHQHRAPLYTSVSRNA
jgi:hypothetical protein